MTAADHRAANATYQRRWRSASGRTTHARVRLVALGEVLDRLEGELDDLTAYRLVAATLGDDVVRRARAAYRASLGRPATHVS